MQDWKWALRLSPIAAALAIGLVACGGGSSSDTGPVEPPVDESKLQVASPDWQDQIIYFVMTDRFNDGDPSNNNQNAGEYDPKDGSKFSGGDLKGITDKIDYIKGLGATTVWITPPVYNQWWDPLVNYGGYHGYWARNQMQVDPHFGSLNDYKRLSAALHQNGMYLIQDIVVNHMANCLRYSSFDAAKPTEGVVLNTGAKPACGPTQAPFDQWDPTNPEHLAANIYHWTPSISDFQNRNQELNYQLADLDDLNTENPVVVNALKDSFGYWIKNVGVDGFRIDTAFYVPQAFFKDFMYSTDAAHPGVDVVAKANKKQNFIAFGEGFGADKPFEDTYSKKINSYMTDDNGATVLPSMINFPMYGTIGDVFAKGNPTSQMTYRLNNDKALYKRPYLMPTFVDNHDVNRFLNGASAAALRQSLAFIMTTPGIPVVYYGTEQDFTEQRGAMFKTGFGSGGKDNFNTSSAGYAYVKDLTAIRKNNIEFRRGTPTVLKDNPSGAGAFAYKMSYGTGAEAQQSLVLMNTSDARVLLDNVETGLPEGTELQVMNGASVAQYPAVPMVVGAGGKITRTLEPRAVWIVKAFSKQTTVPPATASISMTLPAATEVSSDFALSGTATGLTQFKLVVDGKLASASSVTVAGNGTWTATVPVDGLTGDSKVSHTVTAYDESTGAVSATYTFKVAVSFKTVVEYTDPSGDDAGPAGAYKYPTDDSWGVNRQLDLRKVTLQTAGGSLKIGLTMPSITTVWNPQNGFDHVAFSIFIDVPGKTGVTVLPQQNASVPAGMDWDYKVRVHGWSNALFGSAGASASKDGAAVSPAAAIQVDKDNKTIYLTLSKESLGGLSSLSGVKVYVTTWDYDGGYRGLSPTSQQWAFWGGDGSKDPLIMDDTPVLSIP